MSKTTINVTNINVLQPVAAAAGIGSITPGTPISSFVAQLETKLNALLQTNWPASFTPYAGSFQQSQGVMGPLSAIVAGQAPQCVVQEITSDLSAWGLPDNTNMVNTMASEITEHVVANAGLTGTTYGKTALGGAETMYWGVAYATLPISDDPNNLGVVYVYTAAGALNALADSAAPAESVEV